MVSCIADISSASVVAGAVGEEIDRGQGWVEPHEQTASTAGGGVSGELDVGDNTRGRIGEIGDVGATTPIGRRVVDEMRAWDTGDAKWDQPPAAAVAFELCRLIVEKLTAIQG